MQSFEYTAVVWKEPEAYVSKCPELGVSSCGDSFEEAVSAHCMTIGYFIT
jgi:predicted RNase H-like HicB family nuclease